MAWGAEIRIPPGSLLSAQSSRARQVAEGVTTRAMEAKLLEDASHYDWLAVMGDRTAEEVAGF